MRSTCLIPVAPRSRHRKHGLLGGDAVVVTWRTLRHLGLHIPALIGSVGFYGNHMQAVEEGFK